MMKVKTNLQVDTITENGTYYPKEVIKKAIDEYKTNCVTTNQAMGKCDHVENKSTININNVLHKINDITINNENTVEIDMQPIKNFDLIKTLCDKEQLKARGVGKMDGNNKVSDFKIISFDLG